MASLPEPQFEEERGKFDAEQQRLLETIADTNPGEVLEAAERIGVLIEGTKEKIEAVFESEKVSHELLFQRALSKERRKPGGEGAFGRAFEAVYGRFLFEQGDEDLEDPQRKLMKKLSSVLSFPIGPTGLKGRTELLAAVRRLRMLRLPKQQEQKFLTEQSVANTQIAALEPEARTLTTAANAFANFDDLATRIGALPANIGSPEAQTCFAEISATIDAMQNLKDAQVAGIEAAYQGMVTQRDWVENANYPAAMVQDLFIRVRNWRRLIDDASTQKNDALTQARERLGTVNQYLSALGGNADSITPEDIIDKAFATKTSAAKRKELERKWEGAKADHDELKANSSYFGSNKERGDLDESFNTLQTLLNQAGLNPNDPESFKTKLLRLEEEANALSGMRTYQRKTGNIDRLVQSRFQAKQDDCEVRISKALSDKGLISVREIQPIRDHLLPERVEELLRDEMIKDSSINSDEKMDAARERIRIEKADEIKADVQSRLEKLTEFQGKPFSLEGRSIATEAQERAIRAQVEADMKREIEAEIEQENLNVMIESSISLGKRRGEKRDQLRILQSSQKASEALHGKLKVFLDRLTKVNKAGVKFKNRVGGVDLDVDDLDAKFKKINLESNDFSPMQLTDLYAEIKAFFGEEKNRKALMTEFDKKLAQSDAKVDRAKKTFDTANSELVQVSKLTDKDAAKRLIAAIVAEQNPDMSLTDQQKLASMILANDVATIQTEASYAELAQRGSAEKLETVQQAGFKRKLIGFQYKEGDKAVQPFKGLKPEQFNDWAEIERLFETGRLNHQNGFFVLAAMKAFAPTDTEGRAVPQIQAVKLEKKLKAELAKELGVDERMDEAGIDKILNKAFADQLKKAQELVKAYFQHFDRNQGEWDGNKIKELDLRYARVKEERSLGKISDATFQKRMADLVDEAKEGEVLDQVKFSDDSAMAGYWSSPFSQWFRDRGWDVGQYAKGKAKSLAVSGVKLGAFGLWGATKLGLSATLQTALLPLRAVKYPLLLAAKPLVGVVNLFRAQKWTPLPKIRDAVRNDIGRVGGYFKTKAGETWKGAVGDVTGVPKAEWAKTPYASTEYSKRTKADLVAMKEQAEELKAKGDPTPVEVAGSPFIDLKKYRNEIEKLDKILAQKPAEERGDSAAEKRAA